MAPGELKREITQLTEEKNQLTEKVGPHVPIRGRERGSRLGCGASVCVTATLGVVCCACVCDRHLGCPVLCVCVFALHTCPCCVAMCADQNPSAPDRGRRRFQGAAGGNQHP